jgi:hypothetical protein
VDRFRENPSWIAIRKGHRKFITAAHPSRQTTSAHGTRHLAGGRIANSRHLTDFRETREYIGPIRKQLSQGSVVVLFKTITSATF